jgi:hypothetical protein
MLTAPCAEQFSEQWQCPWIRKYVPFVPGQVLHLVWSGIEDAADRRFGDAHVAQVLLDDLVTGPQMGCPYIRCLGSSYILSLFTESTNSMGSFGIAVLIAVVLAIGFAVALNSSQKTVQQEFSTEAVRL